eukprot:tig00020902_g15065.t1
MKSSKLTSSKLIRPASLARADSPRGSLAAVEALGIAHKLGARVHLDRFAAGGAPSAPRCPLRPRPGPAGPARRFVAHCELRYLENPYHNRAHAADVVQSMVCLLTRGGVGAHLSDEDKLGALIACIIHDYEHPGVNNNFLVNTSAPLALLYNDRSPLESHHASAAWVALREPQHNFLQSMPRGEVRELRRAVIDMVLATDMAQHFEILGNFRKRVAAGVLGPALEPPDGGGPPGSGSARSPPGPAGPAAPASASLRRSSISALVQQPSGSASSPAPLQSDDRRVLLAVAMKACDIGHAAKPLPLHVSWATVSASSASPSAPSGALASVFPGVKETMLSGARRNYEHWRAEAGPAPAPAAPAPAPAPGAPSLVRRTSIAQ